MDVDEFQQLVKRTSLVDVIPEGMSEDNHRQECIKNFSMGLCSEAGELVGMLKQHFYQGHDFDLENYKEEIGDMLWYLANLCNAKDITLSECMIGNQDKLAKRYPNGFSPEDSIARVDVAENKIIDRQAFEAQKNKGSKSFIV